MEKNTRNQLLPVIVLLVALVCVLAYLAVALHLGRSPAVARKPKPLAARVEHPSAQAAASAATAVPTANDPFQPPTGPADAVSSGAAVPVAPAPPSAPVVAQPIVQFGPPAPSSAVISASAAKPTSVPGSAPVTKPEPTTEPAAASGSAHTAKPAPAAKSGSQPKLIGVVFGGPRPLAIVRIGDQRYYASEGNSVPGVGQVIKVDTKSVTFRRADKSTATLKFND